MLKNTIYTFKKTVSEIKSFAHIMTVLISAVMIVYLIAGCFIGIGYVWSNLLLAALTLANLVIYLLTYKNKDKSVKRIRRRASRIYKITKLTMNALSLGAVIYTAFTSPDSVVGVQLIFTPILIIIWVVSAVSELLSIYLEKKLEELKAALLEDFAPVIKPVEAVGSFARGIFRGEGREERRTDSIPEIAAPEEVDSTTAVGLVGRAARGIGKFRSIFKRKNENGE